MLLVVACQGAARYLDDAARLSAAASDDITGVLGRTVTSFEVETALTRAIQNTDQNVNDAARALQSASSSASSQSRVGGTMTGLRSELPDFEVFIEAYCVARDIYTSSDDEAMISYILGQVGGGASRRLQIQAAVTAISEAVASDASGGDIAGLMLIEFACLA